MATLPAFFFSHGVVEKALGSSPLSHFLNTTLCELTSTISFQGVLVLSAHWCENGFQVTSGQHLKALDEGFSPSFYPVNFEVLGHPQLAHELCGDMLRKGIIVKTNEGRGLDSGALPLLTKIPSIESIPCIEVSLNLKATLEDHLQLAMGLRDFAQKHNLLVCGSGGAVHNLIETQREVDYSTTTEPWVLDFESQIEDILNEKDLNLRFKLFMTLSQKPLFLRAHPSPDHFLPLAMAAQMGSHFKTLNTGYLWKTLSLKAYSFETPTC